MYEFDEIKGYKSPVLHKINEHVTAAIYSPEKKSLDAKSIISVYNTKTTSNIQLYSSTLVTICDIFITSMLTNLTVVKKKKKSKRKKKKF